MSNMFFYASCDSKYFEEHANAYVKSVIDTGNKCFIKLINPSNKSRELAEYLYNTIENFDYDVDAVRIHNGTDMQYRIVYSCSRFLDLDKLMDKLNWGDSVLITDIDCYVNKAIDTSFLDMKSVGLFLRDPLPGTVGWELEGTHVAAGIVFIRKDHLGTNFASNVEKTIRNHGINRWFVDQVSLWETYKQMDLKYEDRFIAFDNTHMDWEFKEHTWVWTGKGNRKHTNQVYVNKKHQIENEITSTTS